MRRPIYYGWWVLAAAALAEMLAIGGTSYSAGLFVLPLQNEFSLSRAAANSSIPISFAGGAIVSPLVGYLLDRLSIQWVIGLGAIALRVGAFLRSPATASLTVMVLALLIPVAIGAVAIGPLTTSTLASRWFFRRRGFALGVAAVATSAGGIVVVPLLSWAIEKLGWRSALLVEAALITLIVGFGGGIFGHPLADRQTLIWKAIPENAGRPVIDMPDAQDHAGNGDGEGHPRAVRCFVDDPEFLGHRDGIGVHRRYQPSRCHHARPLRCGIGLFPRSPLLC